MTFKKLAASTLAGLALLAVPATADAAGKSPRATFTVAPAAPTAGQQVTFDASASTCFGAGTWSAASCSSYKWDDDADPNDPLDAPTYPLGTGKVLGFTFNAVGTKYVWLTLTDSSGRVTQTSTPVPVGGAPTPTPTPSPTASPTPTVTPSPTPSPTPTPTPTGCDLNATPSNFAAQVSAASAGQSVCLASGNYGTWSGTNKAITVKAADGAAPSMKFNFDSGDGNFTLDGIVGAGSPSAALYQGLIGSTNVTIKNTTFSTPFQITGVGLNVLLDNDTFTYPWVYQSGDPNAKLRVDNGSGAFTGVTVQNSLFANGDLDGMHMGGGVNILSNTFRNICDLGTNHTDQIQFEGGTGGRVAGNFIDADGCAVSQGITSFDGGTNGIVFEDNVVDITRPWGIELYADHNSIVRHNTIRWYPDSGCEYTGLECGKISLQHRVEDGISVGTQIYDNIAVADIDPSESPGRVDHNFNGSGVSFVGPLNAWAGFKLATLSAYKGAASDGLDPGARIP